MSDKKRLEKKWRNEKRKWGGLGLSISVECFCNLLYLLKLYMLYAVEVYFKDKNS